MSTTPTLRDAAQALLDQWDSEDGSICLHEVNDRWEALRAALTQGAGAVEPVAWANMAPEEGEVYSVSLQRDEYHNAALVLKSETAQQLQQAVARAVEECAQIGMLKAVNGIEVSAAIRSKGTHD